GRGWTLMRRLISGLLPASWAPAQLPARMARAVLAAVLALCAGCGALIPAGDGSAPANLATPKNPDGEPAARDSGTTGPDAGGNGSADACRVSVETPTGAVLQLEVAADPAARARGLGGRDGIEPGAAMALAFPEPTYVTIWMKDMRFDIDVVWIDGDRVVDLYAHMPAPPPGTPDEDLPQYTGAAPADVVLELAAGTAAVLGLEPGARVRWDPASPAHVCQPAGMGLTVGLRPRSTPAGPVPGPPVPGPPRPPPG